MRTGRTYEVFVGGKPAGLVGSTVRTLEQRRAAGYVKRFGPTVELRLIREVPRHESEDDASYNFHLKAAEALDIARKKTYIKDGGLNKISPLIQAIGHPMLEVEMGRIGGYIGGKRSHECHPEMAANNGKKYGSKGGKQTHRLHPELASENGNKGGRANAIRGTGVCGRSSVKMSLDGAKAGLIGIRRMRELHPGLVNLSGRKGGRIGGQMVNKLHPGHSRRNGIKSAPIVNCLRWRISRGKPCICGRHE